MLHDHDDIGDFIAFDGSEYDDREKRQACSDCRSSPDDRMVHDALLRSLKDYLAAKNSVSM
jgi:hypothetical protein